MTASYTAPLSSQSLITTRKPCHAGPVVFYLGDTVQTAQSFKMHHPYHCQNGEEEIPQVTVGSVLKECAIGHTNVVSQHGGSLVTGLITLKCRIFCQEYLVSYGSGISRQVSLSHIQEAEYLGNLMSN